jgi:hypothetical protein
MEPKKSEMFYGLLTVKLANPPADPAAQYTEIKKALGLSDPVIDDSLGVVPSHVPYTQEFLAPGEKLFVVGVESKTLWDLTKSGHPNVVGCMHALGYRGGHPPLHLKDLPEPPKTRGGPRRNPGPGGPKP